MLEINAGLLLVMILIKIPYQQKKRRSQTTRKVSLEDSAMTEESIKHGVSIHTILPSFSNMIFTSQSV